jgi:hypothetical protein
MMYKFCLSVTRTRQQEPTHTSSQTDLLAPKTTSLFRHEEEGNTFFTADFDHHPGFMYPRNAGK